MSNSSLDAVKQKLEDTLAPYGYYVARKDTPDALPITFAELGLVVLGLLAWSATQYLKAFFEEMGKQDAKLLSQATPDTNQLDRDKLESKLEETIIEIRDLKRQLAQQHLEPRFQVQQELLGE